MRMTRIRRCKGVKLKTLCFLNVLDVSIFVSSIELKFMDVVSKKRKVGDVIFDN